jgi:L-lysine epsilon oxidase-like protein
MASTYRIFPSIGVARVGEETGYFIGSEAPGSGPTELTPNSPAPPVTRFKDASRTKVRKQGARFRLFKSDDGQTWQPANLPPESVTWSVTLANIKSAVTRPAEPPIAPTRPKVPPGNIDQIIQGGTKTISGRSASSDTFNGVYKTKAADGSPFKADVKLGQLKTDSDGNLIVLGGDGFSSAPSATPLGAPLPNTYYRNPNWHDDVADGPVTAQIRVHPDDASIQAENGAWVVAAPPDYAPEISGVVTMYDVLLQLGIDSFGFPKPGTPSFDLDIAPIISRVRRLRWVHDNATWSDARLDSSKLRSRADTEKQLREQVMNLILSVEGILQGHTNAAGPPFRLRKFQRDFLDDWVKGNFDDSAKAPPTTISAAGLTRAALEGTVGQGFCPGIEAGIIFLDKTLYCTPFDFRINHATVEAGELTALMAQPWQADFLKCNTDWWPTQRPDLAPQADGSTESWIRGAGTHKLLVERSSRLGFIVKQGADEVFVEAERDPTMPNQP